MKNDSLILAVDHLYQWLDHKIASAVSSAGDPDRVCSGCGDCCNFAQYGHRLYVTSVELAHFKHHVSPIKPMTGDICPYQENDKCSVYQHRFASCRIFCCNGDSDFQNQLSEEALAKSKVICEQFDHAYLYTDLATALASVR